MRDLPVTAAEEVVAKLAMYSGRATVTVTGEVCLETVTRLSHALESALATRPNRIEVTFAGVGFCDCSGLNALLAARTVARERGIVFTLTGVQTPAVIRFFRLTQTAALFDVEPGAQSAGHAGHQA